MHYPREIDHIGQFTYVCKQQIGQYNSLSYVASCM